MVFLDVLYLNLFSNLFLFTYCILGSIYLLYFYFIVGSNKQLKSLVQKRPMWRFWTNLHKTSNYLLSCNVTVAKWIASCSQHLVLVIWIEFPPKLYQVTLLLARKVKLPKCQEIPIISAGGKKQFCCYPWWMWLKKKSQTWLAAMDYLDRKGCFRNFLHSKMANFVLPVTLSSATFSDKQPHLFRAPLPSLRQPKPKPTNRNA